MIAWRIDRDELDGRYIGYGREVGGVSKKVRKVYGAVHDPVRFELHDDDGELYFAGLMRRDWAEGDESLLVDPLMFGAAVAGTTLLFIDGELVIG